MNKTHLNAAVVVVICGLSILVAKYSYVGENPQQSALTAVCLVLLSVAASMGNVWLTKRCELKKWTAYITPAIMVCMCSVAAYVIWDFLPNRSEAHVWFNVMVCMAASSLMMALYTAHCVFDLITIERYIQKKLPGFQVVANELVMSKKEWNADHELLLTTAPQENALQAFVGAGNDVVRLMTAFIASPKMKSLYGAFSFPDEKTHVLQSGKLMRQCVAMRRGDSVSTIFSFVLDPDRGEGIVMSAGAPA